MSDTRNRKARPSRRKLRPNDEEAATAKLRSAVPSVSYGPWAAGGLMALITVAFVWSYWPTLALLVNAWNTEPDYSHGFLVIPVAIWLLWVRRDRFPSNELPPAVIGGMALLLVSVLIRYLGGRIYLEAVDGWSMIPWAAGAIAVIAGWKLVWWSLPSLLMLWFMIPMPFRLEYMFRQPLQHLATKMSCMALIVLGEPAIAEGNTIRIGEAHFGVAEACSGLRIFVGIVALAYVYVILVRRSWWIKSLLVLAVLPVTLIANTSRIVITCWLQTHVSGEVAHKFSHDVAGYAMIPFAAALLGLVLWYLGRLLRETSITTFKEYVRRTELSA
jgi:exosortase